MWSPEATGVIPNIAGEILGWLSTSMWGPVVAVLGEWGSPRVRRSHRHP